MFFIVENSFNGHLVAERDCFKIFIFKIYIGPVMKTVVRYGAHITSVTMRS